MNTEDTNFRTSFQSPYIWCGDEKCELFNGRPFRVVERMTSATHPDIVEDCDPDFGEFTVMYKIVFGDGTTLTAWPEEVEEDEEVSDEH